MTKTESYRNGYLRGLTGHTKSGELNGLDFQKTNEYLVGFATGFAEYSLEKAGVVFNPKPQYLKVTEDMLFSYLDDNTTPISKRAKRIVDNLLDSKEFCAKVKAS